MFEYDSEIVARLMNDDNDFRRLYSKHDELKEQVRLAHRRRQMLEDAELEKLKKKKLMIKDQLAAKIESYRRNHI